MTSLLEHKGYYGSIEYSEEDAIFHGKLQFIRDLVTYEGADAKGLRRAFEEAIEDYLALCEREGREPDMPFKGSFNVRPGSQLHRRAMMLARRKGTNLNQVVTEALRRYVEQEEKVT
jgi:predicted HicB family RNase H-like nuclease